MNGAIALKKAKNYTDESLLGGGAVVGKNVTISSISPIAGGNRVTFSYTLDNGTVKTSTLDVKDGVSITSIAIDANNYLVCTMSDGTEQKAKINLLDNVYTKTEADTLLLDKADKTHKHDDLYASKDKEHEHPNKDTLDKFGVNDSGKLTFNGNVVTPEASDLSDYLKKTDAQNIYVAKEAGKGLSENDLTTALKDAYDKAVEDSHTHPNDSVIDKFSENEEGKLLYDGQSIETDLSTVYSKTESDEKFVEKETGRSLISTDDISQITKNKDAITTLNGTGEGSVDKKIADKLSQQTYLTKEIATADEVAAYTADPTTAKFNVIYLVKDENATDLSDKYYEYQRIGTEESSSFEMTGDTSTDFADYAKTTDVNSKLDKKVNTTDIIDNVASIDTDKPLSAAQGKALDGKITDLGDTVSTHTGNSEIHVTAEEKNAIADIKNKADKTEIPIIPTELPANGGNADTVGGFTVGVNVPADAKFTDTITEINDADVSKTKVWSSDKTASEIASAIAGGEVDLSAYQKKNDTGLCTMAQDIVGAINEVKEAVDGKANYDDTEVKADISELQTKSHSHTHLEVLDNITSEKIQSWDNKSEFDGNYNNLSNLPTIPVKLSDLTNDSGYITNIVDDLLNYYKKSDTYSKEEIAELIGNINKLTSDIVESLPTENISTSTIYLIKDGDTNNYKQFMFISGQWAQLSDTNIDLSGYAKLTDLDTKVDKVVGKTLSTNDFTNVLKSKLDGIAEGANKTVVDTELSTTSTNPVQNAIVSTKINTLANKDGSDATGTWGIDISGTAAKATADKNGNDITTTYAKQSDFEKVVGNVDIIDYTDQIDINTDVVANTFSTNIRKVGHIVTFVINITVKAISSSAVQLGTIPKGVRPPANLSTNILTNKGDGCYVYVDSNGGFGIRKISATEFAANDGVRFCANYITEE